MKTLYSILILLNVLLIGLSLIIMEMIFTYSNQSAESSIYFSFSSAAVELFAIFVGIMGLKKMKQLSFIIIFLSTPMLLWSYLMYNSPTHISVDEVIIFWMIYMIGIIVLSAWGIINYKKIKLIRDDGILDSDLDKF